MNTNTPNVWAKRSDVEISMVRLAVPDHISGISYEGRDIAIPEDRMIEVPEFVHERLKSHGDFPVAAGAPTKQSRRL